MSASGKITITVEKAILSTDVCSFSTMDPYFTAYLQGTNLLNAFKSKIMENAGQYPDWDETTIFEYSGQKGLFIEVLHENELIGRAEISTHDIISNEAFSNDYEILKGSEVTGRVFVKFSYIGDIHVSDVPVVIDNTVYYDSSLPHGKLAMTVEKAILNDDACTFSVMDPQFICYLSGSDLANAYKSQILQNAGKYPDWDETLSFEYKGQKSLFIEVLHEKELLARTEIDLSEIVTKDSLEAPLKADFVLFIKTEVKGKIFIKFAFNNFTKKLEGTIAQEKIDDKTHIPSPFASSFKSLIKIEKVIAVHHEEVKTEEIITDHLEYHEDDIIEDVKPIVKHEEAKIDLITINTEVHKTEEGAEKKINKKVLLKTLYYFKHPVATKHNSFEVYSFNLDNLQWTKIENYPKQYFWKFHRSSELPDGSFLVTGGEYSNKAINTVFHYAPHLGVATYKEYMKVARKCHSTAYLRGYVYVFGGFTDLGTTKSVERYNVTKANWENVASMNYPRAYATAVPQGDKYVFLVGGFCDEKIDGFLEINRIERYDAKRNIFEELKFKLPTPIYGCVSTFVSENKLLIAGGHSEEKGDSSEVYTLKITDGSIKPLPNLKKGGWTVLPPYFNSKDSSLNMFFNGEEEGSSEHISYSLKSFDI